MPSTLEKLRTRHDKAVQGLAQVTKTLQVNRSVDDAALIKHLGDRHRKARTRVQKLDRQVAERIAYEHAAAARQADRAQAKTARPKKATRKSSARRSQEREALYVALGRRIRFLRTEAGLTLEELGLRLDPPHTRASMNNIELAVQRVLVHTLLNICRALEVPVEVLLEGVEDEAAS